MAERETNRTRLRLVQGGLQSQCWFQNTRIVAAPEMNPPFEVQARAFEEDTFLIMSAKPTVCDPPEHPIRVMTDLIRAKPERVGSVRVQGINPLRFLAIVHDVNQDPTWQVAWIRSAFAEIWQHVEDRKLTSIGIPLLGMLHGKLELADFVDLFASTLKQSPHTSLKRVWLITPTETISPLICMLQATLIRPQTD